MGKANEPNGSHWAKRELISGAVSGDEVRLIDPKAGHGDGTVKREMTESKGKYQLGSEAFQSLYRQGCSDTQIAEATGFRVVTVMRMRDAHGWEPNPGTHDTDKE